MSTLRGHEMDASFWVLHNVLSVADEDLEGIADVQGQVGAQTEAHGQTTVAVDDADPSHYSGVHGCVDAQRSASSRNGRGDGYEAEILAVFE